MEGTLRRPIQGQCVRAFPLLFTLALLASVADAAPFWGAKESLPADASAASLKPGQFIWAGDAIPAGPIVVAVSLAEQRAYVYRNGIRIGVSSVSTGKPGHETPTGVFTVLQKDADHRSSKYDAAPMPYTERLTWDGIALHAGGLPGYPSSHGCVHLPSEFARRLFQVAPMGMVVVVADQHSSDADVSHPSALSPLDPVTGAADELPPLAPDQEQRWTPDAAPAGPISIVMSAADRRLIVFRNGVEIGRAKVAIRDPAEPFGTHVYTLLNAAAQRPDASPDQPTPSRWLAVSVPGHEGDGGASLDPAQVARVTIPPKFLANVRAALAPGATLVVTDKPVLPDTTGVPLTIVNADPPPGALEPVSEPR
jgi:hypothetical protein